MLRILRIAGILFFALMIGVSANNLWKMNETGELFEKYNSARKMNLTIFGASVIAVITLGAFELKGSRRRVYQSFGSGRDAKAEEAPVEEEVSTDIYAAPETAGQWGRRRATTTRGRYKHTVDLVVVWMWLLRIFCFALPALYLVLLGVHLMQGTSPEVEYRMITGAFSFMAVLAFVTAVGISLRKSWGYTLGYLVAIINLVVFPYGTALGLIVLVTLVGSASLFSVSDRDRRRTMRKKQAEKSRKSSASPVS